MKLKELLVGLEGLKAKGTLDVEIKGIESNSKNIRCRDKRNRKQFKKYKRRIFICCNKRIFHRWTPICGKCNTKWCSSSNY